MQRLIATRIATRVRVPNRGMAVIKRFYKAVDIAPHPVGGHVVLLDRRQLKTPKGTLLTLPSPTLAELVAYEWHTQGEVIVRETMHVTHLCNTAIDNPTGHSREHRVDELLQYFVTDTLRYRVPFPDRLVDRMVAEWDPVIAWFAATVGCPEAIRVTDTLSMPADAPGVLAAVTAHLLALDDFALTGAAHAIETCKSVMLGVAVAHGHLSAERAALLSRLELDHQIKEWGNVEWAHDVEQADTRARLAASALLVRAAPPTVL